ELDLTLFDREGREPRPTPAARSLEPMARQIASQLRQLDAHALALHRGLEQQLVLAVAPELISTAWSHPLPMLAQQFPALAIHDLTAAQEDALRMLHEGSIHLAVVFERACMDEREAFQELGSEIMVAVLGLDHPLAKHRHTRIRIEDLIDLRQIVMAGRNESSLDPRFVLSRHVWRTDSHLATLGLVQAGLGWAYLPQTLARPLIDAGNLIEIAFDNISNQMRLWVDVVWSKERPLGLGAQRYIELIRAHRNKS